MAVNPTPYGTRDYHSNPSQSYSGDHNRLQRDLALIPHNVDPDGNVDLFSTALNNIGGTTPTRQPIFYNRIANEEDILRKAFGALGRTISPLDRHITQEGNRIIRTGIPGTDVGLRFISDGLGNLTQIGPELDDPEAEARRAELFPYAQLNLADDYQASWRWNCRYNFQTTALGDVGKAVSGAANLVFGGQDDSRAEGDRYWMLAHHVQEAQIPQPSFQTNQWRRFNRQVKLPGIVDFGPLTISFFEDAQQRVRRGINEWQTMIADPYTGLYALPKQYKRTIVFSFESSRREVSLVFICEGCYPTDVSPVPMSSTQNEVTVDVTFNVDRVITRTPAVWDLIKRHFGPQYEDEAFNSLN